MPKRFDTDALRIGIIEGKFSDLFIELTQIVLNLPKFINNDDLKHTTNISHIYVMNSFGVFLETRARNDEIEYSEQLISIACELVNNQITINEILGGIFGGINNGDFLPNEFKSKLKNILGGYLFDIQE